MPLATITLALLGTVTDPAVHAGAAPVCQDTQFRHVRAPTTARPHHLGDEPPALQVLAVLRTEGGCSRPVLVSDRLIGAPTPR